jgi:hypothetical protein
MSGRLNMLSSSHLQRVMSPHFRTEPLLDKISGHHYCQLNWEPETAATQSPARVVRHLGAQSSDFLIHLSATVRKGMTGGGLCIVHGILISGCPSLSAPSDTSIPSSDVETSAHLFVDDLDAEKPPHRLLSASR